MKKLERLNCLNCNQLTKRSTTKYCSCFCRAQHFSKLGLQFGGPSRTKKNIFCLGCNVEFYPKYKKTKYCSKKCAALCRSDLQDFVARAKKNTGPRNLSIETRKKMSLAASKRNAAKAYTKGIGGIREDIGFYVRSSWEANLARILIWCGISFKYEPDHIELHDKDRIFFYTPDFKLKENVYLEVKGWWTSKSILIKQLMTVQKPDITIIYITPEEYKQLEVIYDKLPGWERRYQIK